MRKNIVLSMQTAELAELDKLARELGLSRSAAVRLLVTMYYGRNWACAQRRGKIPDNQHVFAIKTLTNERKVE